MSTRSSAHRSIHHGQKGWWEKWRMRPRADKSQRQSGVSAGGATPDGTQSSAPVIALSASNRRSFRWPPGSCKIRRLENSRRRTRAGVLPMPRPAAARAPRPGEPAVHQHGQLRWLTQCPWRSSVPCPSRLRRDADLVAPWAQRTEMVVTSIRLACLAQGASAALGAFTARQARLPWPLTFA